LPRPAAAIDPHPHASTGRISAMPATPTPTPTSLPLDPGFRPRRSVRALGAPTARRSSGTASRGVLPRLLTLTLAGGLGLTLAGCNGLPAPEPVTGPALLEPIEPDPSSRERLTSAQTDEAAGDYEAALASFQRILAENPTVTAAYLGVGRIRLAQSQPELAEPAFRRAARLEPRNFDAQYGHGLALRLLGRVTDAVLAFQRALTIRPDDFDANRDLAISLLDLGRVQNARTFAQRAVDLRPDDGEARVNLGAIESRAGNTGAAIEQYVAAIELMGNEPRLLTNLVYALADERRYEEAINVAEQLVRIAPSADVLERLGWCNFKLRRYDEARMAYESALELDEDHWPSLNGLGVSALNAWLLSDRTDAAERAVAGEAFRQSLRLNSEQQAVINLLIEYRL
jgi:Flp pilus assembly protein TadD